MCIGGFAGRWGGSCTRLDPPKVELSHICDFWVVVTRDGSANARGVDVGDPLHVPLENGVEDCGAKERAVTFPGPELQPNCIENLERVAVTADRLVGHAAVVDMLDLVCELRDDLHIDHGNGDRLLAHIVFVLISPLDRVLDDDLPHGAFIPIQEVMLSKSQFENMPPAVFLRLEYKGKVQNETNSLIVRPGIVRLLARQSIGLREIRPRWRTILGPRLFFRVYRATFPLPGWDDGIEDIAHLMSVDLPFCPGKILVNQLANWPFDQPGVGFVVGVGVGVRVGCVGLAAFVFTVFQFSVRCSSHGQDGTWMESWEGGKGKRRGEVNGEER